MLRRKVNLKELCRHINIVYYVSFVVHSRNEHQFEYIYIIDIFTGLLFRVMSMFFVLIVFIIIIDLENIGIDTTC